MPNSHEQPYYADGSHGYWEIKPPKPSAEDRYEQREYIIKHIMDRGGYEYSNRHEKILAIWKDYYLLKKYKNLWRAVNEHIPGL